MKDLLKLEKCPISGLPIITKPEWKYIAKDGSCAYEIALIGDNILYEIPIGSINTETIEWYTKTANKIIAEYFKNRKYYLIYDYSLLDKTSLKAKKLFINWFVPNVDKVELVAVFGMNQIMKVAINTVRFLYEKNNKLLLSNSYQEAINVILQKQNKSADSIDKALTKSNNDFLNNKQTENPKIKELIAYLGKMTFAGNLNQKIPVLPDDDPLAELFAAVAANQEGLREMDKEKENTNKKLEKLIVEKDKALEKLSAKETETKKANEHLETIIKGANLGWWDWDIPSGNEIYNEILTENLGYKLTEITPHIKWWEGKIHPDDEKQVSEDLQKHLVGEAEYYENKHRLKTKSGEWKWFSGFGKVVERDKAGKAIRMIGVLRDIDKEERAKQNVRDSEEYHRTLIENSIDVMTVIDNKGNIVSMSKSSEKLFGYTNEERKRKNAFALMLPDDRERMMQVLKEIIKTPENYGSVTNIEFRAYHKDGSIRYVEGTAKNMLHSPIINGVVLNYRDVTERVMQQSMLKQSEQKFKGLFTGMSLGVIFCEAIYDENKNMIDCIYRDMNTAYEEFTNLNKKTAIGCKVSNLLPGTEHHWFSAFGEVVRTGKPISFEMYNTPIKKHFSVFAYRNKKDNFTAIFEDITERKINEKEIKDREAYLEALNEIGEISFDSVSVAELQSFVEIIGKVANASRTYIFKNHRNQNNELLLSQVAEYVAKGIKPEIDNPELQNLNYNDWLPRWEKLLKNGEIINGRVAGFPETERHILEPQEIISLIVIPIFIEETFWGFLGFDNCIDNNEWNDNDIKYFKIATKRLEHSIELVAKQKLLERENKRFKITMDAMNSGVYVADMQNYELLFLNKFFTDLIGDKAGEKCYKALQGLDEPCSFCTNNHLLSENQKPNQVYVWEFQNRITKRWYQLRDHAIRWVDGRMVRMEVAVDITGQIEANKQITKLSQVVKTTSQSVVITDLEGNIIFVNEALVKIGGFDNESEIIGKSMYAYTDEQGVTKLKQEIFPNIFDKGFYYGELNLRKKDNSIFPAEVNGSFIKDETGKPELLVAMFSDISERKQAEKDIISAKEKAEESNRLKTAFLNNMSHEIRTPLNGITGFLGLLQDPNLEDEHKQGYIDIINKSSNRLIDTVTDIIEISKIEAGLIEVSIEEVPVNEMLNELYSFFGLEANNKGLKLIQLPSLSDDGSVVLTDNHKLNGILSNLVKNAIKFTDKGSVAFGYNITTDFDSGPLIQFFVKDTGIGVPEERQRAIFNRFEQADIEDTRVFEGSGLGLAIAKSYVEMLGGKIWLKTEEGIGTEFMFTIPYKTKTGLIKNEAQQKKSKNKQGGLKALTVLIAEDEEVNKLYFKVVFKNIFRRAIYVETGQQAIDACRDNPEIDFVLMDIKMPKMSGYTATREIRKFNKEVIIIAQTAFGLSGDREKSIEAGCNDHISKPVKKKDLFEKIESYFN